MSAFESPDKFDRSMRRSQRILMFVVFGIMLPSVIVLNAIGLLRK
jgi:hypothetical protein